MAKNTANGVDASYAAMIKRKKIFRTVICIFLCIISLLPFYIMIINATLTSQEIKMGIKLIPGTNLVKNFTGLLAKTNNMATNLWQAMGHSVLISVPATLLQVYFATFTAYGLTVYQFKLRNLAWSFIMAIMMIPAQVSIIGFMNFMIKIGLYNTYWPLIIPAIAAPSTVYFMKQYMTSALSVEIIEAARIDGSGEFATFNKIALPLMKPAIAVQAIFTFVSSWNNYFTPALILHDNNKKTLPILLAQLRAADWLKFDMGQVYVMITFSILPVIVVYLILSKHIVAGVALGSVKG